MSLELAILGTHTPRMCFEEKVADFQQPLVKAMHQVQDRLWATNPELLVIVSTHWVASFNHYIDATPLHEGDLTAMECPDMISNVHYRYPGDPDTANAMVEAGKTLDIPIFAVNDPTYVWDYGTVVPLRYLVPKENLAVVNMTVCLAASLDETYNLGRKIGEVLRKSPRRTAFMCSGALAHNLVRGPSRTPTPMEQVLEDEFTEYLVAGEFERAWKALPQFSKLAGVESGGRHVATLLGVLHGMQGGGEFLGWGPSSGSGNPVVVWHPQ